LSKICHFEKNQVIKHVILLLKTTSDTLPSPKLGPKWALVFKTAELWGLEARSQLSALKGVEGRVEAPGWD
jgi:hypothetical protein